MTVHVLRANGAGSINLFSECLHAVTREATDLRLNQLQMFLLVARQEGLTISELTALSGQTAATVSRGIRAMTPMTDPGSLPPASGLVFLAGNPRDGRMRHVLLTDKGRRLHDEIALILNR